MIEGVFSLPGGYREVFGRSVNFLLKGSACQRTFKVVSEMISQWIIAHSLQAVKIDPLVVVFQT